MPTLWVYYNDIYPGAKNRRHSTDRETRYDPAPRVLADWELLEYCQTPQRRAACACCGAVECFAFLGGKCPGGFNKC